MDTNQSYYSLLHVRPDAPPEIIEASYRTLMKGLESHPDPGEACSAGRLLREAFSVLADRGRRERYDRELARQTGDPDGFPGATPYTLRSFCPFCQSPCVEVSRADPEQRCPRCDSPLGFAFKVNDESGYRRSVERIEKEGEISYYTGWPDGGHAGRIRNLSPNGIRFSGNCPPEERQVIKVDAPLFRATGRTIYCQVDASPRYLYVIGMEFLTVVFARARGTFTSTLA